MQRAVSVLQLKLKKKALFPSPPNTMLKLGRNFGYWFSTLYVGWEERLGRCSIHVWSAEKHQKFILVPRRLPMIIL